MRPQLGYFRLPLLVVFFFVLVGAGGIVSGEELAGSTLLAALPDGCPTPDGMAIAPDGALVVACPNYADQDKPACLIRLDSSGAVSKWIEVPVLGSTGVACPMGICFDPEGALYVVDNQGWTGSEAGAFKGRILKLRVRGDKIAETTVVASGMEHPNGIRWRRGKLYVTASMLTKVEREDELLTSAVYVFDDDAENIEVANTLEDEAILTTFVTQNRHCQYGADGLVFDSQGNLYVGNFGDGALHKICFAEDGTVASNTIFARTDHDYELDPAEPGFLDKATKAAMRTTDGICVDCKDNIYVADFSNNAVTKVTPQGKISVLAQNGDTDGTGGLLDQPGEPIVYCGRLVVTCFDVVVGPDKVNTGHDAPFTIVTIPLD